jgi:hypothetical protein
MSQTVSVPGVGDLEFPDGMSEPDMAAAIQKNFPDIHPNPKQERKAAAAVRQTPKPQDDEPDLAGAATRTLGRIGHGEDSEGHGLAAGVAETALSGVTAPIGGLAGLAALPFVGPEKAAKVSESLTYKPSTQSGRDVAALLTEPIRMGGEKVGEIVGEAGRSMAESVGASPQTQQKIEGAGRSIGEAAIPIAMVGKGLARPTPKELPPVPGKDYSPLRALTPDQEARYRDLKDYKPTLGQVTRNAAQMTFEEQESLRAGQKPPEAKASGEPTIESTRSDLNEQLADQNKKLADNLRKLSTQKGPTKAADLGGLIQQSANTKRAANAKALADDLNKMSGHPKADVSDSEVGTAIQRSADAKLRARKADVKLAYDDAVKTEGGNKAPISDLDAYFEKHKTEEIANPALAQLHAKWNEIRPKPPKAPAAPPAPPAILDASGKPIARPAAPAPETPPLTISIKDLDQLYKAAGRAGKPTDPTTLRVANEVKDVIRGLQDQHGGPKYQAARAMRNQQGLEFEEQGGVNRIVKEASRTDTAVDASQLPAKILKGSVEDLKQTLNTVGRDVRPGSTATRVIDNTAISGLRQKALNMLQNDPKSIPRENVDTLFGKTKSAEIYKKMADAEAKTKAETSHADAAVDASTLPDKILRGTTEDLKKTLATLNRSGRTGTETTRMADASAVNGLKQHAINSVLEEASGAVDAKGVRTISPTKFRNALDKIGRDNLEVLFDKATADQMYKIADDAELLKVKPQRAGGSDTANRTQVILDKAFTNRAAYVMEQVAKKFTGGFISGSIRWAREAAANFNKSQHELENATEARFPTRASAKETAALAKPVKQEISRIRMQDAKKRAAPAAAAALTMNKKRETATP